MYQTKGAYTQSLEYLTKSKEIRRKVCPFTPHLSHWMVFLLGFPWIGVLFSIILLQLQLLEKWKYQLVEYSMFAKIEGGKKC